jgi:hypothetical protein
VCRKDSGRLVRCCSSWERRERNGLRNEGKGEDTHAYMHMYMHMHMHI